MSTVKRFLEKSAQKPSMLKRASKKPSSVEKARKT
jgi:hypothetical protein